MNQSASNQRKSQFFTIAIFCLVVGIFVFAYIDWQKRETALPAPEDTARSNEEIQQDVDEILNQFDSAEEDSFLPKASIIFSEDELYLFGSSEELTYIQGVNKESYDINQISTLIDEKQLTSVDVARNENLIAYTTAYQDNVVSGAFIISALTFEKRVLAENVKNQKTLEDISFSDSGTYVSFLSREEGSVESVVFSLAENKFDSIEFGLDEELSARALRWTHQDKILAIASDNQLYQSISRDEPHRLEKIDLKDIEGDLEFAHKSPKESLYVLISSFEFEGTQKKRILVYNGETGAQLLNKDLESIDVQAFWNGEGKQLYVTIAGDLYVLDRDNLSQFPENPEIKDIGAIHERGDSNYFYFKKDFIGSGESLSRIDVWNMDTGKREYQGEPAPFAEAR